MAGDPHILLVDDERDIRDPLAAYLSRNGLRVTKAENAAAARQLLTAYAIDLVLLDIMMPGEDGLSLAGYIRATSTVPVILLTAKVEEMDRVVGLEIGADDYVTKPFSPRELVARTTAVLRRVRPALAGERLAYADIEMDVAGHKVRRGGAPVALGPTEFRLLRHFLEHPGRVFSRERLLNSVWGQDSEIELRTVDVHIRRLRKAINAGQQADIIRTVRSAGYALDADGHR
jgi:two-component system phosphate regulon response regulator PhoB